MDFELSLHTETVNAAYPSQTVVVSPGTSVHDALLLMKAQKNSSVLVCEGDAIMGIFTERDALRLLAKGDSLDQPIESVMSCEMVSIHEDTTVGEAIQKMAAGNYRRLPIVDNHDKPIGVTGAFGIVHYLVDHFPESIYNLPPSPSSIPSDREGA